MYELFLEHVIYAALLRVRLDLTHYDVRVRLLGPFLLEKLTEIDGLQRTRL